MYKLASNNKSAIIILHEIYGINSFIKDTCSEYYNQGFDVYCPDMLQGNIFSYSESDSTYAFFINKAGFEYFKEIELLLQKLKLQYDKVFILGFSAGATIAWRCSGNTKCDGIICCYGSRIRDYLSLQPACPVLLLFAEQDSFDVDKVIKQLQVKANVELYKFQACHGYMDKYSNNYDENQAQFSKEYIKCFLERNL